MRTLLSKLKCSVFCLSIALLFPIPYDSTFHGHSTAEGLSADYSEVFRLEIPQGIPKDLWLKYIPTNNPLTSQKVALGELLYFDKRLSADLTLSCAVCHDPATAFADHNLVSVGREGRRGTRNVPTLLNAMFAGLQFWDGRATSLEEQAKQPLINLVEMGMKDQDAVVARVASVPEYREQFRRVFGRDGITIDTIVKAIAAFERTQLSGNSPFDRFMVGDSRAMSERQNRGWALFKGKAECIKCHTYSPSSPFFTDFKFHNTGVAANNRNFDQLSRSLQQVTETSPDRDRALSSVAHTERVSELGRYLVTKRDKDMGAFKTPTLRDVELTAPYMHDGSEKTLIDVLRFYNRGGNINRYSDERMRPLRLTDEEVSDLIEFMRALTGDDVLRVAQSTKPQTRTPVSRSLQKEVGN